MCVRRFRILAAIFDGTATEQDILGYIKRSTIVRCFLLILTLIRVYTSYQIYKNNHSNKVLFELSVVNLILYVLNIFGMGYFSFINPTPCTALIPIPIEVLLIIVDALQAIVSVVQLDGSSGAASSDLYSSLLISIFLMFTLASTMVMLASYRNLAVRRAPIPGVDQNTDAERTGDGVTLVKAEVSNA